MKGAEFGATENPKHLNTPRLIADDTQKTVWKWEQQEPFGANACNPDPDADNLEFEFNLRFPGQYFDRETNLHYNYFRDYDPAIGRYGRSDPVGLRGGINTYAYVESNPLRLADEEGLESPDPLGVQPKPRPGVTSRPMTEREFCVVSAACAFAVGGGVTFGFPGAAAGLFGGLIGGTVFCPADPPTDAQPPVLKPPVDPKKPPKFYF